MQRLDDGYCLEEPGEVFCRTTIKTTPAYADERAERLVDIYEDGEKINT